MKPFLKQSFLEFILDKISPVWLENILNISNVKILFVDDDDSHGFVLKHYLSQIYGISSDRIVLASDPAIVMEILKEKKFIPDLVVSDTYMPHMNGDDFVREIKAGNYF
ncbi:MAG: hypothetical protein A2Y40_03080 [Candidatus Margulisbacteria bacterium GWF2_35_9]|nr:MAG: hypothetical protein A2Y40_03080 [Candidatus Margulisbacteria bacterium GWF2_35_9]